MDSNASYVDFNADWSYVIQWLHESEFARKEYHRLIGRAMLAKHGKPCRNLYQEELTSNLKKAGIDLQERYKDYCNSVPEGNSMALRMAVDNIASQMAGGVDAYDYQINDTRMAVDPETLDLLAAQCEQDYIENRLVLKVPTFSNDILWTGIAAALVKYDPKTDSNRVLRVNPRNIWFDTKYSSLGEERFRGYSTMISWKKLKKMIEKDGDEVNLNIKAPDGSPVRESGEGKDKKAYIDKTAKYSNRKIRSLNGLDIYVESLNKLATSASLAGEVADFAEYDHDLHQCYNLGWYQSYATDPKKRTNNGYNGDDVELTVIYDLAKKIEFKIINRRYVISANQKAFKRKIKFSWTDPRTGMEQARIDDFYLDCPLKFGYFAGEDEMDTAPHPWTIVFDLLNDHDQLCAWRAKREHVTKILSILRIDTNGADAESIRGMLNIMGGIFDDLQGDVKSLQLDYNYDPLDSEITHIENKIQKVMHAYDQFDALQAMGDRASAAESGMAQSAVAQGLTTHQDALMTLFADIARQNIANRVAYSSRQEFPIVNNGDYRTLTVQEMALNAIVEVKPKLAKQIQQKQTATNALAILGNLAQSGLINKQGMAGLTSLALLDVVPRKVAESWIQDAGPSEQEMALATQTAQNDAMALQQNQQMYEQNPIPYEVDNVMQTQSPDDIDQVIAGLSAETEAWPQANAGTGSQTNLNPETLDMAQQDGAMAVSGMAGMTPDLGSALANPNGEI